ncbi:MAG: DUF5677 domain-containing protein [Candidatus Lokiarchaeota archaeon]|nr:DUF5677 domain-containing protein [Candidatus Lokiarchaeota archaeon]
MAKNMIEYINYFNEARRIFKEFGSTISDILLDEKNQPFELYNMLAIKLCEKKSKSISLLLTNQQYADAIILTRQIMELLFNINWIKQSSGEERNERVYKLEAEPYYNFSKEIRDMEINCESDNPVWDKENVIEFRKLIEFEKDSFPFLVEELEGGGRKFKRPEPFIQRLDPELKLRYYHLYRFTSLFVHPGPKLKEAFLKRNISDYNPNDTLLEPTKQILAYTLLFEELIMGYACEIFKYFNKDKIELRDKLYADLAVITDKANNGYFGKPI